LYLLQSKLQDVIRAWVETRAEWPPFARSIAYKHLDEGLIDRGITRDIAWGVPVTRHGAPRPGFETKVFYVWFDAPIEYIAATQEWADARGADWRCWWRTDAGAKETRYVQFMGKDNVAFHTVSFPATLLGSGEPWKTVDVLKALNHLNWYGGAFSTSRRRGIFQDAALEILPADCWRWLLTASSPENADSSFTFEVLVSAVNRDLADVLGNFVNRVCRFCEARFEGRVPAGGEAGALEKKLYGEISERLAEITAQFEAIEIRKTAQALRALWAQGNEYLQEAAPWSAIKSDPVRAAVVVRTALNLAGLFARVSAPVIPFACERIAEALGEPWPPTWPSGDVERELARLEPGRAIAAPEVLFRKIEADDIARWKERFGAEEEVPAAVES
ncbi:MAG: methionine--tRNA ligase, partial [Caulobacteraceae bacterium]